MVVDPIQYSIQIKDELCLAKEELMKPFRKGKVDVTELMANISEIVDEATDKIAETFLEKYKDKVCVVYTGANGREEASPHSDVDVFLLIDNSLFDGVQVPEGQEEFEEAYTTFVRAMGDALDASISIRTVDLSARDSINEIKKDGKTETWTQQIDRREGWGSGSLFAKMDNRLKAIKSVDRLAFIQGTFDRYDKSLQNKEGQDSSTAEKGFDGSRYTVIEPNVKGGYGSLRGYQTAKWILEESRGHNLARCKIIKKTDDMRAGKAYKFLQTTRAHLHDITGNKTDKLYTRLQPELAKCMGYVDEKGEPDITALMKDFFTATRIISNYARIVCSDVAEKLNIKPPGASSEKTINFEDGKIKEPIDIMRLFLESTQTDHTLHYSAMYAIEKNVDIITDKFVQNPEANRIMMEILSHDNAEETLMYMNKLGALTKFIPELDGTRELMEFDPHHAYTVDDHMIVGIGNIADLINQKYIERSPTTSGIASNLTVEDRKILSIVLLLHGVYKAEKSKDDKDFDVKAFNQELLQSVGTRLGLEGEDMEIAAWLMENRLLLKHTARYTDIEELEDITNFAEGMPSAKHLDLLRVLTFADSRALGPGRPSAHSSSRADEIYKRSHKVLSGLTLKFNHSAYQLPADYEDNNKPYIRIVRNEAIKADVLTVITPDKPYLIENISAAILKEGCKILNARVTTVPNGSIRANNTFVIQNSVGGMLEEWDLRDLEQTLLEDIQCDDRVKVPKNPTKTGDELFPTAPTVEFSNEISNDKTVVHIVAANRPGLFHILTVAFNDMDLNFVHGNITTQGPQTTIASQVHKRDGGQVSEEELEVLKGIIMAEIGGEEPKDKNAPEIS